MQIIKQFNTILEKDLAKHCIELEVIVRYKNGKIKTINQFSQSFSIDEIYHYMRAKHAKNDLELIIRIKE